MAFELTKAGMRVEQQCPIQIQYEGHVVGVYFADILIQGKVLMELKATKGLDDIHLAQCYTYLKATGMPLCLLINFGAPKIEIKRIANKFRAA